MAKLNAIQSTVPSQAPGTVYLNPSVVETEEGEIMIDFGKVSLNDMVAALGAVEPKADSKKMGAIIGLSVAINPAFTLNGVEEVCSHPLILAAASPNAKTGDTLEYRFTVGGRSGNWLKATPALKPAA